MSTVNHFCYFNLHKKVFSLRNTKTRLVDGHAHSIFLLNPVFKVSQAGRSRVLTEKRKNVHAGIQGYVSDKNFYTPLLDEMSKYNFVEVTYNPYKYDSFVNKETGQAIDSAKSALLSQKRVFVYKPKYTES